MTSAAATTLGGSATDAPDTASLDAVVIGCVIGGVGCVALVAIVVLLWRRRSKSVNNEIAVLKADLFATPPSQAESSRRSPDIRPSHYLEVPLQRPETTSSIHYQTLGNVRPDHSGSVHYESTMELAPQPNTYINWDSVQSYHNANAQ